MDNPVGEPRYEIVPLHRSHDRKSFDCGIESMNTFIRQYAVQNAENFLSTTQVAIVSGRSEIIGYYTTTWATATFAEVPVRGVSKQSSFPVGLLAQLAVDRGHQQKGLGGVLLVDALSRFLRTTKLNPFPAVVLDLREPGLRSYYEKYGFVLCDASEGRMYLPTKTLMQMEALLSVP